MYDKRVSPTILQLYGVICDHQISTAWHVCIQIINHMVFTILPCLILPFFRRELSFDINDAQTHHVVKQRSWGFRNYFYLYLDVFLFAESRWQYGIWKLYLPRQVSNNLFIIIDNTSYNNSFVILQGVLSNTCINKF